MRSESEFDEFVQRHGRVVSIGTAERGLVREDALAALDIARREWYVIAGGDVYLQHGDQVQPALADWHVEPSSEETFADYLVRSCEEAANYIARYPKPSEGIPLFVLVTVER